MLEIRAAAQEVRPPALLGGQHRVLQRHGRPLRDRGGPARPRHREARGHDGGAPRQDAERRGPGGGGRRRGPAPRQARVPDPRRPRPRRRPRGGHHRRGHLDPHHGGRRRPGEPLPRREHQRGLRRPAPPREGVPRRPRHHLPALRVLPGRPARAPRQRGEDRAGPRPLAHRAPRPPAVRAPLRGRRSRLRPGRPGDRAPQGPGRHEPPRRLLGDGAGAGPGDGAHLRRVRDGLPPLHRLHVHDPGLAVREPGRSPHHPDLPAPRRALRPSVSCGPPRTP